MYFIITNRYLFKEQIEKKNPIFATVHRIIPTIIVMIMIPYISLFAKKNIL